MGLKVRNFAIAEASDVLGGVEATLRSFPARLRRAVVPVQLLVSGDGPQDPPHGDPHEKTTRGQVSVCVCVCLSVCPSVCLSVFVCLSSSARLHEKDMSVSAPQKELPRCILCGFCEAARYGYVVLRSSVTGCCGITVVDLWSCPSSNWKEEPISKTCESNWRKEEKAKHCDSLTKIMDPHLLLCCRFVETSADLPAAVPRRLSSAGNIVVTSWDRGAGLSGPGPAYSPGGSPPPAPTTSSSARAQGVINRAFRRHSSHLDTEYA